MDLRSVGKVELHSQSDDPIQIDKLGSRRILPELPDSDIHCGLEQGQPHKVRTDIMKMRHAVLTFCIAAFTAPATADEVGITADILSVTVQTAAGPVEIMRNQDNDATLEAPWTQVARPCPNFCIQPMTPAPGVTTIGELEVLQFLRTDGAILVDGRIRSQYEEGTIPGAISVPYTEAADRLDVFNCEIDFDGWICEGDLPTVILFCNGPWCGQSPTAARRMIEAGFPAEKIFYYRGGMQSWNMLGLTVVQGVS